MAGRPISNRRRCAGPSVPALINKGVVVSFQVSSRDFRLGSEAHKALLCRTLLDTHDPYRPAVIDWPKLDLDTRNRIVSLPA
jgi:hypothetical protein